MSASRKSKSSPKKSRRQPQADRPGRQLLVVLTVCCLLAGAAVYALNFRSKPDVRPNPPADDPPKVAEPATETQPVAWTKPVHDWRVDEYVGSAACADCHLEIAEMYADHPMANTMALVADSPLDEIEDGGSVEFEAQGCRYRVDRKGDRLIHTEFLTDDDGKTVYEQSVDVQYASGSGTNAKTYLIDRGGSLFESPITWYVEKQKWDLSPGYHNNPRQRFNRRVSDGCLQCHAGRVAPAGDGTADRFEEPPFLEMEIGCERCHGPGKKHVEKYEADDWGDYDETLIVNPADLDRQLSDAVCYQCHRDGKRRILRKGRSFHDFQPGMATEDVWTVFASSSPSEAGESQPFTSQVEQMRSSACFRGTDGQMQCITCHDPHFAPKPEAKAQFYRERCNRCHSEHGCSLSQEEREQPPALNSCIHCHMPVVGSSDIPHTSQSDHRVLRDPHNHLEVTPGGNRGQLWTIFDDSEKLLPEWELQRAQALALCDQAVEESNPQLIRQAIAVLETVSARSPDDLDVLRKLGFLYELAQNHEKAIGAFEAALRVDPQDEMSLKNLGLIAFRTRNIDLGLRSYETYLNVNKWDATMFAPYVRMLAATGKMQAARDVAERGLQLDPTQRELRALAGQLNDRLGDSEKSREHQEALREIGNRLDPWDQKRMDRLRNKVESHKQPGQ